MSDKPIAPGYIGTGSNENQEKRLKEHFPPAEEPSGDPTKAESGDPTKAESKEKPWWKFW